MFGFGVLLSIKHVIDCGHAIMQAYQRPIKMEIVSEKKESRLIKSNARTLSLL
jgi:hypothetical protein